MRVVYIDSLFLLDLVMNYLLLLVAGRLAGEGLHRLRLLAGAAVGAAYAVAVFLPGMAFLLHPLCKLSAAVVMLLCGYGGSRQLLRVALVFFGAAAAFGGGIYAIALLGGRELLPDGSGGFPTLDLRLILLLAAGCYVAISLVFRRLGRHSGVKRELAPAVVRLGERKVSIMALLDTGNTLTDPVTNRPVMVAEGERLAPLFPPGAGPAPEELRAPAEGLEALHRRSGLRWRLLPYQAVGVECALLLAFRADRVTVGGEDYGSILVALSPGRVSDGGSYSALISP